MGLEDRILKVRDRMSEACDRSGRNVSDVQIVAVTKKIPPEQVAEAFGYGVTVFGESKVQEAKQKIPLCSGHLEWHMIGHLQANKVREAVRLFSMIHSIDSVKLLEAVDRESAAAGKMMKVCLEVNISGEQSKDGFRPEDVPAAVSRCDSLMNVDLAGLMTIVPYADEAEETRTYFRDMRELRDRCRTDTGYALTHLSMGMSHDFEVAVEEGATLVRLGRILFDESYGED